jgi:ATP-binding cassette, subfamily B, multidrug efflux pump
MRELRALLPYLRPYRLIMAVGLATVVISNALNVRVPWYLERGIDALRSGAPFTEVRRLALVLVAVALAGGVARFFMRQILNSASRRVETDLRNNLFDHVQSMSAEFHDRYPTGELMARATNDLLAVRMVAGPALMYVIDTIIRTALIVPAMLRISAVLAALSLLPLLALPAAMVVLGNRIHRRTLDIQNMFGNLSSFVHENLSGVRVVRAYRQEQAETEAFRELNEEYRRRNLALARVQGVFYPLLTALGGVGALTILYVGGRLVIGGTVTVGAFVAFGVYLAMLVWPMIALGWAVNLIQRGAASMARINELFRAASAVRPPMRPVALPPRHPDGRALTVEGVWFRYPGAVDRGWVLEDISFHLEPGASLAVVGPTGAGKSALADLLVRTYDPDRGRILIDGVDIRDLGLPELRAAVGFVPQETFLFSETLRENVLLGAPDDGRLQRVAEISQLSEALSALPKGYDTMLGERGINLSGGQKQRTAIARALAQDPPIFVLDDALSAVDAHTEARILAGLRDALARRTSVIISHRLAAVRDAGRILVLERGRIVEDGIHAELVARDGRYWELLRRQQIEEEIETEVSGER